MSSFFRAIAVIFHPLFMPFYGALIALYSIPYFGLAVNPQIRVFMILLMAVNVVAPAISLGVMVSRRIISDVQVSDRSQRYIPLLLVIFYYSVSYIMMRVKLGQAYLPVEIYSMFIGLAISLVIALLVSFRFKISLHSLGAWGILGMVYALALKYDFDPVYSELFWIVILSAVAGLVGSSRLYTNHHKFSEILAGGILGFVVNYSVILNGIVI